ncbi:unnamed protein product [Prorocentrum cordatum]|uniref:GRAM domain-containing protein n=1 Tax=Prorocentrum cordatum TaxID=2364126 RepID=A0ABN9PU47_9DINO|nr:unnamed protein product [Polarella glacialis]
MKERRAAKRDLARGSDGGAGITWPRRGAELGEPAAPGSAEPTELRGPCPAWASRLGPGGPGPAELARGPAPATPRRLAAAGLLNRGGAQSSKVLDSVALLNFRGAWRHGARPAWTIEVWAPLRSVGTGPPGKVEQRCWPSLSADEARSWTEAAWPEGTQELEPQAAQSPHTQGDRTRKRDKVFGWLQDVSSVVGAAAKSGAEVAAAASVAAGGIAASAAGNLMSRPPPQELTVEPLSPGFSPASVPGVTFENALAGEVTHYVAKKVCLLTNNPFCETGGRLLVTNFRLKFQVPKGTMREELQWMQERKVLDVPHGAVEDLKVEKQKAESGMDQFRLRLRTKDLRSLTFLLADEQDGRQVLQLHLLCAYGRGSPSGLFAFAHRAAAEREGAGPTRLSAAGWRVYDPHAEYARMGVDTSGAPAQQCPWSPPRTRATSCAARTPPGLSCRSASRTQRTCWPWRRSGSGAGCRC